MFCGDVIDNGYGAYLYCILRGDVVDDLSKQPQLRGRPVEAVDVLATTDFISSQEMIRHLTEAAEFLHLPLTYPSDHIGTVNGPEKGPALKTHPLHSLFSLTVPVLRHVLKASLPFEIVLHDGVFLSHQLTTLCKALRTVSLFTAPIRFTIVMSTYDVATSGPSGRRTARELKQSVLDTLLPLRQYGDAHAVDVVIADISHGPCRGHRGTVVAETSESGSCGALLDALEATRTKSTSLSSTPYVLHVTPDVSQLSHAVMFYLHVVLAKISLACAAITAGNTSTGARSESLWNSWRHLSRMSSNSSTLLTGEIPETLCDLSSRRISLHRDRSARSTRQYIVCTDAINDNACLRLRCVRGSNVYLYVCASLYMYVITVHFEGCYGLVRHWLVATIARRTSGTFYL